MIDQIKVPTINLFYALKKYYNKCDIMNMIKIKSKIKFNYF